MNWPKRDDDQPAGDARIRTRAAQILAAVARESSDKNEIETLLDIGAACPFTTRADLAIWLQEVQRVFYA